MTPDEKDGLVEELASAYRETRPHGEIVWSPAFFDLDAQARQAAFEEAVVERRLQASSAQDGLSGTARAVMAKILRPR